MIQSSTSDVSLQDEFEEQDTKSGQTAIPFVARAINFIIQFLGYIPFEFNGNPDGVPQRSIKNYLFTVVYVLSLLYFLIFVMIYPRGLVNTVTNVFLAMTSFMIFVSTQRIYRVWDGHLDQPNFARDLEKKIFVKSFICFSLITLLATLVPRHLLFQKNVSVVSWIVSLTVRILSSLYCFSVPGLLAALFVHIHVENMKLRLEQLETSAMNHELNEFEVYYDEYFAIKKYSDQMNSIAQWPFGTGIIASLMFIFLSVRAQFYVVGYGWVAAGAVVLLVMYVAKIEDMSKKFVKKLVGESVENARKSRDEQNLLIATMANNMKNNPISFRVWSVDVDYKACFRLFVSFFVVRLLGNGVGFA